MSRGTNILEYTCGTATGTSSTTTRARAREVMNYAESIGLKGNPYMADWVYRLLENEALEEMVLLAVLDEAMLAPYPSWRYVAAIVRRLLAEKMPLETYTMDDWNRRRSAWESRKGLGMY